MHYNGADSYLFVNCTEIIKFKANDSEIVATLGNISNEKLVNNMNETGLKGFVFDFSIDYDAIEVSDILDIYKNLMEKNGIV